VSKIKKVCFFLLFIKQKI